MHVTYVLHTRPYRDTSLLVDLFSREHGRIGAIARGVRGPKSRHRGLLQPFTPLLVSWFGKSDLVTLNGIEPNGAPHYLTGDRLLSGLYMNELLVRALHQADPHPALFDAYTEAVEKLATVMSAQSGIQSIERILRLFEKQLLQEVGYGGENLQDVTHETLITDQHFLDAKRLMRTALLPIIGNKPLKSRELFVYQ
jgi:DNA repair protein RecO (recombination protein O)